MNTPSIRHITQYPLFAGCRGGEDAEDGLDGGGEDRLPLGGGHDEALRPPQRRQAARRLHAQRAGLHRHGVHALRRPQDIPLGQVQWGRLVTTHSLVVLVAIPRLVDAGSSQGPK